MQTLNFFQDCKIKHRGRGLFNCNIPCNGCVKGNDRDKIPPIDYFVIKSCLVSGKPNNIEKVY